MSTYRKKLIEVALPLPEINDASAYDKMPGIGPHPKGIHHWWARLPLPAARAVLFASVVDDPSEHPEKWPTEEAQKAERERLFEILRRMMGKKLHEHPEVYAEAHAEMLTHCDGNLPAVFDPFSGGGSIPLEANRLGFEAHAADLNPVAVLLNKCNLELAPRWTNRAPINPADRKTIGGKDRQPGTRSLAADVRYYGKLVRERAISQIGHLYPKARLPKDMGAGEATVIAWLWARTVSSPDPAVRDVQVPLLSTYWLSTKKGREAWLAPVVDRQARTWRFEITTGTPVDRAPIRSGTKRGRGARFACLLTGAPIPPDHIRRAAADRPLPYALIAIVADSKRGRQYLPADSEHEHVALSTTPSSYPDEPLASNARYITPTLYGIGSTGALFTPRQLSVMVALSDLIIRVASDVRSDATKSGMPPMLAEDYTRTVVTFLAFALDRCADFNCALSTWKPSGEQQMHLFTRQAYPMVWDFAEANLLGDKAICWHNAVDILSDAVESIACSTTSPGSARHIDAATGSDGIRNLLVSTDPPYYDNIPYSDLSDFFYVWLRRTIGPLYPDLFGTVLVPKLRELTASAERFDGDKETAKVHFESGFRSAFTALRNNLDVRFPLTVYYAFKQEDEETGIDPEDPDDAPTVDLTTGWETLLEALVGSGFRITATWPIRASQAWRMRAMGSNALASYVVLACRPRLSDAASTDRRAFVAELKAHLPTALRLLQQGNIAPVDFAQAAIGPGMAVFSQYSSILESSGKPMSVRTALSLINQTLTEVLSEQEDDFDADTRWALSWFEQHGFGAGDFGNAELLSKAKVTSVDGLRQAGLITSKSGQVRLIRPEDLPKDWNPATDKRLTVWEMTHHLLRVYYHEEAGDASTATLLRRIGSRGDVARDLAYRLFNLCEKKKWSTEAQAYNALVLGWPEVARIAREARAPEQGDLFGKKE